MKTITTIAQDILKEGFENFEEYRKDIETQFKEARLTLNKREYTNLVSAKTEDEFWKVLNRNSYWCGLNRIKIPNELLYKIKDDSWKYDYCKYVTDRRELWSTITDDFWKFVYCLNVKDRKELWSTITEDEYKYKYCLNIKDRRELWSTITDDNWKYLYCKDVKDREELK